MEVRANYIVVGCFALLMLFASLGFTLWIAKQNKGIPMQAYDIYMKESVMGLSVNNDVLFNGVLVGKVSHIRISHSEPGSVIVRVNIFADTPVREDSEAALEMRGVTGVYIINISGGSPERPVIELAEDEVGTIRFRPSPLAAVVQTFPETLGAVNQVLAQIGQVFSSENIEDIHTTIASIAKISSHMAQRAEAIDSILQESEKTAKEFNALVSRTNRLLATAEPGIKRLSAEGFTDMRMLMIEARTLVQTLNRIGKRIESDPRRFFFGDNVKEYKNP